MESKLWILTEAKKEAIVRRENVLKESKRLFAEQSRLDWNAVKAELDLQRRYKIRMGVEIWPGKY